MFRFSIERLWYVKLPCATYLASLYVCFLLYSWSKIINRSNHLPLQICNCFETLGKARTMRLLQSTQTNEFNATWRVTILLRVPSRDGTDQSRVKRNKKVGVVKRRFFLFYFAQLFSFWAEIKISRMERRVAALFWWRGNKKSSELSRHKKREREKTMFCQNYVSIDGEEIG